MSRIHVLPQPVTNTLGMHYTIYAVVHAESNRTLLETRYKRIATILADQFEQTSDESIQKLTK